MRGGSQGGYPFRGDWSLLGTKGSGTGVLGTGMGTSESESPALAQELLGDSPPIHGHWLCTGHPQGLGV